jgi:hypothetical protein
MAAALPGKAGAGSDFLGGGIDIHIQALAHICPGAFRSLPELFIGVRKDLVVRIQEVDIFSRSGQNACISGGTCILMVLGQDPESGIRLGIGAKDLHGAVGRAVVHTNDLQIGKGGCQYRIQTFFKVGLQIVDRNAYRDLRSASCFSFPCTVIISLGLNLAKMKTPFPCSSLIAGIAAGSGKDFFSRDARIIKNPDRAP